MKFSDVYIEITKRRGQTYTNYADRAKTAFWKAVNAMIQAREYREEEILKIAQRHQAEAYLANEFPYSLINETSITQQFVFNMSVELTPGYPDSIRFTRLDDALLNRADYFKPLSAGGVKEVFYALKYPLVEIKYNTGDGVLAAAFCNVTIIWNGVPKKMVEETDYDNTESSEYMTQGFIERAIEAATQILATES